MCVGDSALHRWPHVISTLQELQDFAAELASAGASIKALNMAASPHMLRSKDYEMDIVRVGAALYGQQGTVPGTRSAAKWLARIATLKKVGCPWAKILFFWDPT